MRFGGGGRHQRSPERRASPGRYRSGSSRQRSRSLSASRQSARTMRKGPVSPPPLLPPPHAQQLQQPPGSLVTLVGGDGGMQLQQPQYNPMPMYHANVPPVHGGGYGNYGPPPPVVSYGQQPPVDLYAGVGGGGYGDYGMPPQLGPPPGFDAYAGHGMPGQCPQGAKPKKHSEFNP